MVATVNTDLQLKIDDFKQRERIPSDVTIKLSGQSEQEKETNSFPWAELL